jgi:gliding motility-associated-like protein
LAYWSRKVSNSVTTILTDGKFLKKLMYNDIGWDGFQWRKLFSSDYWFTVELGNGRNLKVIFTKKGDSFMM